MLRLICWIWRHNWRRGSDFFKCRRCHAFMLIKDGVIVKGAP